MRFFADHCFFGNAVTFLKERSYDIVTALETGLNEVPDEEIVSFCRKENRIILTLDTDFASLYRFT